LGKEVFMEVLRSLHVTILQTEFEADEVIHFCIFLSSPVPQFRIHMDASGGPGSGFVMSGERKKTVFRVKHFSWSIFTSFLETPEKML
jgi:hypothetical protein